MCMLIDIPEPIYRLLCFRYIFLIYLGYLWVSNKMSLILSTKQIILSILSITILIILYYSTGSLKPFLHDSAWRTSHWICYFYAALLLPWLLWKLYDFLPLKVRTLIGEVGKCSYEIFLFQMVVFTLYPRSLLSVGNDYIDCIIFSVTTLIISVIPAVMWKRYTDNIYLYRNTQHGH